MKSRIFLWVLSLKPVYIGTIIKEKTGIPNYKITKMEK